MGYQQRGRWNYHVFRNQEVSGNTEYEPAVK